MDGPEIGVVCQSCQASKVFSFEEWYALEFDEYDRKVFGPCPACGEEIANPPPELPEIHANREITPHLPGYNISKGTRTDAQQEALYSEMVQSKRKAAAATKAARKGTKRPEGELRHIGSVPRELHIAMTRSTGNKRYWDQGDIKKTLKRHDLLFDT